MNLHAELGRLAEDPFHSCDLAELAFHLAKDEYPDLDVEAYLSELAAMAREAESYVRGDLNARVTGLCRYLFHEMGFRGNDQNYYDPRNSYLNEVLDRRKGIPLSLSLVAMTIGARVGLEVVGVGLPGHFVAKAVEGCQEIIFDPFHGGRLLNPEMCEQLVERVTGVPFQASPKNLTGLPTGLIVQRMLMNLKGIYLRDGAFAPAIRVIERLRLLNPEDLYEQRDLGISLMHAGCPGRAIDHLSAYLARFPNSTDAETVRKMLTRARDDVSQWN